MVRIGVRLVERGNVMAGRGGCTHRRVHREAITCALTEASVGNAPSAQFRSDPALLQAVSLTAEEIRDRLGVTVESGGYLVPTRE